MNTHRINLRHCRLQSDLYDLFSFLSCATVTAFKGKVMWFIIGVQNFIAKCHRNDNSFELFLCDFKRIWHKSLSNSELLSISQTLNPLLEASVEKLKDVTLKILKDEKVKKEIKEEENDIFLKLESNILGMKFQFQLLLTIGDGEMLYKEFTIPVLLVLKNTQKKMKKLIDIIKDKDEEISDYKQEYGIKSSCLATKHFSEKEFDCQESSSAIPWDQNSFLDCINAWLFSVETVPKVESQEELTQQNSKSKHSQNFSHKDDAMKSIFKDENFNRTRSVKSCVLLNNQTIKKRKKLNEEFKIRF